MDKIISFRVREDRKKELELYEKLKELSDKEDRSLSQVIRIIIKKGLDSYDR